METFASAPPMHVCLDRETLVNFDLGRLPAQDLDSIGAHISSCPRCEELIQDLHENPVEDSILDCVRRCINVPPTPPEAAYLVMQAMAEAIGSSRTRSAREGHAAEDPGPPSERLPRTIDGYVILERIGHGGMGIVYRARQVPLDRMVALKMILAGHHAGEKTLARFELEGRAVARLQHPNVVQVFEFGEHEGLPFYSMELVGGGSLQERLEEGPLDVREAASLTRTLAAALAYAHGEGVLHRDLKPANILLAEDGTPKIADFGLAKLLDAQTDGITCLTETGVILGTTSYMAPEQADGRPEDIGVATDVYALGAILYESLTGLPPFTGTSKVQTLDLVRSAEPAPPSRRQPGVPFWLESICLKCLEKSPEKRYPSAWALADDLDRWLRDERPRGAPGRLRRIGKGLRRNAVLSLIGLAVFPMLAAVYTWDPDRPLREIHGELQLGRPVALVGEDGRPRWSRWITGGSRSQAVPGDDGRFTVHSWTLGLLELLPEIRTRRFRLSARIAHEKSDMIGEVGIYFARRAFPRESADIQFVTQLSFNAVRGDADLRSQIGDPGLFAGRPLNPNAVKLFPHILSDEASPPAFSLRIPGVHGPRFLPRGEKDDEWHDLEVTVTPESVTAGWDGQPFTLTTSALRQNVDGHLELLSSTGVPVPLPRGFAPEYDVCGGLGLYIFRGSASFRSVIVTPLESGMEPSPRSERNGNERPLDRLARAY